MKKRIKFEAQRLTLMRANVPIDFYTGEVINFPTPEVPTRLVQQFDILYKSLKSLDGSYRDQKTKEIISHIASSSGDNVRSKIYNGIPFKKWIEIPRTSHKHRLGYKTTRIKLDELWSLGLLEREDDVTQIGGYEKHSYRYKRRDLK